MMSTDGETTQILRNIRKYGHERGVWWTNPLITPKTLKILKQ